MDLSSEWMVSLPGLRRESKRYCGNGRRSWAVVEEKFFQQSCSFNSFAVPMEMRGDEIWKYFIECMRSGQVIEGEKNACSKCRQKPLYKKPQCFRIVIEDYAFN